VQRQRVGGNGPMPGAQRLVDDWMPTTVGQAKYRDAVAEVGIDAVAAKLLTRLQARPGRWCHLAGIYQLGPGTLRDAATARRAMSILEEHGWVTQLVAGTEVDGARKHGNSCLQAPSPRLSSFRAG
jgi:hypothetical protein